MQGTIIYAPRDVRFEERPYRGIDAVTEPWVFSHDYGAIGKQVGRLVYTANRSKEE